MKVISKDKVRELKRDGRHVKRLADNKRRKPKAPDQNTDLKEVVTLLGAILSKEAPAPKVEVTMPATPKKWKFTFSRNKSGFIDDVIAKEQ